MFFAIARHITSAVTTMLVATILISSAWAIAPPPEGLVLWLDASDVNNDGKPDAQPSNGKPLASWLDKSGKANHFTQDKLAQQPTCEAGQFGGKPAVRFHGNDQLTCGKIEGFPYRDQPIHIVLVMRTTRGSTHSHPRLLEFQPTDGDLSKPNTVKQRGFWVGPQGDGRMRIGTHYGDEGSALSVSCDARSHVVEIIYAGAQNWIHFLDGARNGAGLLGGRDFHGFKKEVRLAIGQQFGWEDPNSYFEGDLAEVLIYNRMLEPEEQNSIKSYLAEKYALDLSIETAPHFERDVRPILAQHCHECHGSDLQEAGVDLRSVTGMLRGGDSGPVISRGHPEFSDLMDQIIEGRMPPEGADLLDNDQISVIRRWIETGASADEEIAPVDLDALISEEDRSFWAFQKLARHEPPKVTGANRVRTPIDAFVLAKLEPLELTLAPEASRVTLLRRICFDLLGLPPSPQEMLQFLANESDQAYEQLVDRLLASEHFGERWGRSWLDWSGYVDVFGRDNDFSAIKPLRGRWRYRDYVIRALNHDKPWNRFLMEQLAGDELVDWRNAEHLTPEMVELLTATGFLLCADDDTDQNELNTPDIRNYVLQQTGEIVANNLFALTVACAKCHNHKYEPIAQLDYYRWLANFSPVFNPQRWATSIEHGMAGPTQEEKEEIHHHNADIDPQIAALKEQRNLLDKEKGAEEIAEIDTKLAALNAQRKEYPVLQVAVEQNPPSPTYLLRRGQVEKPGVEVQPASLTILTQDQSADHLESQAELQPQGDTSGRRLEIAKQVTNPDSIAGALVARVFVNRLWQELLGKGIVETSDNFGISGARPTHPELLDWLATEFIEGGWKVKPLVKKIVMSSVYRQAPFGQDLDSGLQADPANNLLWHGRLRQLSSEHIRDRILAVSGQLDRTLGGPPIPLLARPDGKIVINMDSLPTSTSHLRRSLYILNRRNYHLSMLTTFDQPFLTSNCTCRKPSAVVTQSLTMMNDEFVLEQAVHFAQRVAREAADGSSAAQVDWAYQLALCRTPSETESRLCVELIDRHTDRYQQLNMNADEAAKKALVHFCHTLFNTNEFLYVQ
jgi:hypothetical protein